MFDKVRSNFSETVAACVLGGASLVTIFWLILQSFAENWRFPALIPANFTARAWLYLFDSTGGIGTALLNSLVIAVSVTFLAVVLALPAAKTLVQTDFRGKKIIFFVLLLPIFAPSVATAIGGHALFLRLNLTETWTGVILAHLVFALPYCILTLASGFARFDSDLEIQAINLGASRLQIWLNVILPSLAPSIAVAAVLAFLISWSQYLTTLLIGGGKIIGLPLLLVSFQRGSDEAVSAVLTIVFLLPVIAFLFVSAAVWRRLS